MSIRCIVVTPERTEFDRTVEELVLPMYDGELGIRSGRAAMIGR
jgi:F-type H+-transporting ATPase subunit epsilon